MLDNKLTINGRQVEVLVGETLLEACAKIGIPLPTACHDTRLEAYGGCRTCLVELEGSPRLVPSCKTLASPNMVISTASPRLEAVLNTVDEMLACTSRAAIETWSDGNRFIGYDPTQCIMCDRCVRYCDEVMQCTALEHVGQGSNSFIQPTQGESFLDTSCELCGGCIGTCPTDALYSKQSLDVFNVDSTEVMSTTRTVCNYCGVGCVIDIEAQGNTIIDIDAQTGVGPNDGHLCTKGRFAWQFINHPERLHTPLIRNADSGEFEEVSWEKALAYTASSLKKVKQQYGADSIAFLASSRCTNEDVYALQKFARVVVGTNSVHSCAAT
ncbi:MAG: putative molibdopterin-dependent oxidoreductase YjgC [Myxococcota bacterium]|jgi:predicted molibdopterin-dependent oxidoreductase YjgC